MALRRRVNGAFDPREQTFDRFNAWYGEPKINQKTVFANMGYDLAGGAKLYGWASYQDRNALSAGFYRIASDARNTISIYPDGFLPLIAPEVQDYSGAGGVTWALGDWSMDTSLVYGLNKMDFTIKNTLNRSEGAASKTEFDAGGFDYDQLVFNFSGVRGFDVGLATPLNVALGLEARRESYSIHAGEPDSYINGGVRLPDGTPTQSGSQVFPGFRPSNEVDKSRTAVGVYADLETRITEKLLASAALREERYSDFGTDLTGKLAVRYDFAEPFALRGSVQNGFRAPSLQQQYFATTSTNFIGGVPFDITTFPATDPVAVALGARPLTAEKSVNFSIGSVIRVEKLNVTIDAYRIDITNRIVLSENLTQPNVRAYLTSLGFVGVALARHCRNLCHRCGPSAHQRCRAPCEDARGSGRTVRLHEPFESGPRGGEPVRSIPGCQPSGGERHRHFGILQLLAVRPCWPVHLRPPELRLLIGYRGKRACG
jgi:iron complex outermembrane recepter protein